MSKNIIQFGELETLLDEPFGQEQVVRVIVLETSESMSSKIPSWRSVHIGVHVRSINAVGHVLACHLPVASLELFNGRRENDPGWQEYDAAWEEAVALKERVVTFLQAAASEKGFSLRTAGVIELGDIRLLRATWKADSVLLAEGIKDGSIQ